MSITDYDIGTSVRSADGFAVSGDAAVAVARGAVLVLAIVDALGHGPSAHAAAVIAEELITESTLTDPPSLLAAMDAGLAGTVGAAAAVAMIDVETGQGTYTGVGNTVGRIIGPTERGLISSDGIVGKRSPRGRAAGFSLGRGETLLMHTDGISSRLPPSTYTDLLGHQAENAAREMVRRFGRSHDDCACIVVRRSP